MFVEPILKRLEHKIQSTVGHVSGAAIALAPLLVAVGFGTAAADSYFYCVTNCCGRRFSLA